MIKKILTIALVVLIGAGLWYLFIKPYDYLASFKVKTTPGTINQSIKLWNSAKEINGVIDQEDINNLKQTVVQGDSTLTYIWHIKALTDSTSKVEVYVQDLEHSLNNKLSMPFGDTNFEQRTKKTILDFHDKLEEHLSNTKITIVGMDSIQPKYSAYIALESNQFNKARGMMETYAYLTNTVISNHIKPNGKPFIEIVKWHQEKDSLEYNFCFPIVKTDTLPIMKGIGYKELNGSKAIKAIYNGNYITSDRAWYALQDYAKQRNIEIRDTPVEVFHNNPSSGTNELQWKTEVYMPVVSKD